MIVQVPGILDSISTMKDRTIKLVFRTQELPAKEAGVLHGLAHQEGWVVFAPNEIDRKQVPTEPVEFDNDKSQGQRIRACLYRLWESRGKHGEFEIFYRQQTEKFIEAIKEKI